MAQNPNNKRPPKVRIVRINLSWILYLLLLVAIGWMLFSNSGVPPQKIEWTQVQQMMRDGDIKEIHFVRNDYKGNISVKPESMAKYADLFANGKVPSKSPQFYFFTSPQFYPEEEFAKINSELPAEGQVRIYIDNETRMWGGILEWVLPFLLIFLLYAWLFRGMTRQMGGGGGGNGGGMNPFNVGKSTGKLADKDKVNVTFKDVAGMYGAKEEVMEIVDFLKNPGKYTALGGKIPKGALLVGPPGTGKTLLAKAVAGEANVPFFSISGSDFVEMFVGVGASRVRDLFAQAKEKAPCIVFIDEIDAVGRARGKNVGFSSNDERENTLNQLLTEMDGFGSNSGVIVLAATNRADILDKALMRAGRFDRQIHVTLPDLNERKEIFLVHTRNLKLAKDFDVEAIAKHTPGFSGADIANICNEAALGAARKGEDAINNKDFADAVDRVVGGIERKKTIMSPDEKRLTAYHEAGHAVAGWLLPGCDPVLKVSIIPRGQALGLTWSLPDEKVMMSRSDLMDEMCCLVGGRIAEEIINDGVPCTGALNDFERMTKIAYAMVTYYGMSEKVGNLSYYNAQGGYDLTKPYSEKTAQLIDEEARSIIDEVTARTRKLLEANWSGVVKLAEMLIEKEVIMADDIEAIFGPKAGKHGEERLKGDDGGAENGNGGGNAATTASGEDSGFVTDNTADSPSATSGGSAGDPDENRPSGDE
ncbi:MAG TPA: ATP-dependent zinc metalloprotease FtsH [Candidatus Cryptobacteroides merdipullorum]|uniref:ATP-dependent zinc metalloprotease FtsH n=1 Tax=Candidatus Cryptobacteroides merdipullorum TaxID=2840771 RepID=A0A9D1KI33_9BACT|nr:ATP-dependent zinc metalloprotease FtsH [Candidatus Cryptobacteroides merdipullorum]